MNKPKFTNEEICNLLAIIFIFWTVVFLITEQFELSVFFLFFSAVSISVRAYYYIEMKIEK